MHRSGDEGESESNLRMRGCSGELSGFVPTAEMIIYNVLDISQHAFGEPLRHLVCQEVDRPSEVLKVSASIFSFPR